MGLLESFSNPSNEFRQAPFWFWNHRLDKETLDWQIEQMHDKGIGGYVMHARHGLMTPYLSDEWFEYIRFACDKARELGMIAWAYDERDWPSGPAGGTVIADHANRLHYLRFDIENVQGPCTLDFDNDVVCAYVAESGEAFRRIEGRTYDVPACSNHCRIGRAIAFECPAILWFESYLDTLDPNACLQFIRSTYDLHEKKLGNLKELGLAGFFTDEPAFSTYPDDLRRIPWTAILPSAFLATNEYDLLDSLPDLFAPGDKGAAVRYDYWDMAATLFETSFFEAIATWCESRGLELIGHALGEEPLFFQFRCVGDLFRYLKNFHRPGLDHLGLHIGKGHPGGMSPKMIESAALLAGRERTMTETFGVSGWGLTLRDMKWMTDWQIVHGINYIIPHAFYYSVAGRRKKDAPPSEFFQAPYWPYYRTFADYTARLTSALTGGEHIAPIAVLYPMTSVWADFVPGDEMPESVQALERAFWPLGEALSRLHRDFVVVDELSLLDASLDPDKSSFNIGALHFDALIIPRTTAVLAETLDIIEGMAKTVRVIAIEDTEILILWPGTGQTPKRIRWSNIEGIRIAHGVEEAAVASALVGVAHDVSIQNAPDIYYLHRRKEGKDLFFFANTAREPLVTIVSVSAKGYAEFWDAETGENAPVPGQRLRKGRLEAPLRLAAMGSALLVVDPSKPLAPGLDIQFIAGRRIPVEPPFHFNPNNGNFLILRDWRLTTVNRDFVTELHYAAQFVTVERLANMRLILDGVPGQALDVHEAARPIMANDTDALVMLDGEPVTTELPWEIDPKFRVLDLRGRCRPGTHVLEIIIKNNGWFPQPGLEEYAWLAGDFHIDTKDGAPCLVPFKGIGIGPWEDQGYPYFSGIGAYYADVNIPIEIADKPLFLDAGNVGGLLEIEINGHTAGVRAWPPYRIEVTPHIKAGPNLFVFKVANAARNFFEGPDKNSPSGLLSDIWLEAEG